MKKLWFRKLPIKQIFLFFLLTMLFLSINLHFTKAWHNPIPLIKTVDNFFLFLNQSEKLCIQSDYTLEIEIKKVGLYANASVTVYNDRGELSWRHGVGSAIIQISSPDSHGFNLTISGNYYNILRIDKFVWIVNLPALSTLKIVWFWRIESWIDKYTILGMGLGGLILMVFVPTWVALMIKKKGITPDSIERFGYAMLLFFVGFGLVVIWLWS